MTGMSRMRDCDHHERRLPADQAEHDDRERDDDDQELRAAARMGRGVLADRARRTSGSSCSRAWIVMCSAPWYWNTRLMSGACAISTQVAEEQRDPDEALDEVLDQPVLDVAVVTLAMNSGSRKKTPTPARSVSPSISAMGPLPSSTPSSSACTLALRTSQRVPTTSVSYRTTRPRRNGSFDQRVPWKPRRVARWPRRCGRPGAERDRDRVPAAHQHALDERLTAIGEPGHRAESTARGRPPLPADGPGAARVADLRRSCQTSTGAGIETAGGSNPPAAAEDRGSRIGPRPGPAAPGGAGTAPPGRRCR